MKIKSIRSDKLIGTVCSPPDKSISHRAVILSTLTKGESFIDNLLNSEDVFTTLEWAKTLGVKIKHRDNKVTILSKVDNNFPKDKVYNFFLGNSGTSGRLLMGVMAGIGYKSLFHGDKSLHKRPMLRVIKPLCLMGASIKAFTEKNKDPFFKTNENITSIISQLSEISLDYEKQAYLPIFINGGNLNGIKYHLKIASAQVKSAILLAGLFSKDLTFIWEHIPSRNHTENMLVSCGINLEIKPSPKGGKNILLKKGTKTLLPQHWIIPGDFSSASFIIIAALLVPNSEVIIKGVNLNPLRTGLLQVLFQMGANIRVKYYNTKRCGEACGDIYVKYTKHLQPIKVTPDIVPLMIDEFPILGCLVSTLKGKSEFLGVEELRYKESDRIKSLESNLNKLGIKTKSTLNSLVIYGNPNITKTSLQEISANLDHRIAMSFLILGLILEQGVIVKDSETINTSFPNFLNIMQKLKANIIQET